MIIKSRSLQNVYELLQVWLILCLKSSTRKEHNNVENFVYNPSMWIWLSLLSFFQVEDFKVMKETWTRGRIPIRRAKTGAAKILKSKSCEFMILMIGIISKNK